MFSSPGVRSRRRLIIAGLVLLVLGVTATSRRWAVPELVLADECIYVVGARNLVERGSLNTNYYLGSSLMLRGYPHRDVHMPGYILALAPFVAVLGPGLAAPVTLNVLAFLGSTLCLFSIGERVLGDELRAGAAAALFTLLPPFPGYLWIAYSEHLIGFALLGGVAWLLRGGGSAHAAVAGVLVGLGALLRESLLGVLPLYLLLLRPRDLLRGFAPALLLTLAGVVAPLSADRAVHPNGLYPSILEQSRRAEQPLRTLAGAVWENASANLRLLAEARPFESTEDLLLGALLTLALAAALATPLHRGAARRFAIGTLASLALLTLAVLALYVIRVRGGVWGGVRAYMPWAPLLLLLAQPLLPGGRRALAALALLATAIGFALVDREQLEFHRDHKRAELEDQQRLDSYLAPYLDPHHPHRVVGASWRWGLSRYPVEVVWRYPRSPEELEAFAARFPFEFLVVHGRSRVRETLRLSPRFVRVNSGDRRPEWVIWRRVY